MASKAEQGQSRSNTEVKIHYFLRRPFLGREKSSADANGASSNGLESNNPQREIVQAEKSPEISLENLPEEILSIFRISIVKEKRIEKESPEDGNIRRGKEEANREVAEVYKKAEKDAKAAHDLVIKKEETKKSAKIEGALKDVVRALEDNAITEELKIVELTERRVPIEAGKAQADVGRSAREDGVKVKEAREKLEREKAKRIAEIAERKAVEIEKARKKATEAVEREEAEAVVLPEADIEAAKAAGIGASKEAADQASLEVLKLEKIQIEAAEAAGRYAAAAIIKNSTIIGIGSSEELKKLKSPEEGARRAKEEAQKNALEKAAEVAESVAKIEYQETFEREKLSRQKEVLKAEVEARAKEANKKVLDAANGKVDNINARTPDERRKERVGKEIKEIEARIKTLGRSMKNRPENPAAEAEQLELSQRLSILRNESSKEAMEREGREELEAVRKRTEEKALEKAFELTNSSDKAEKLVQKVKGALLQEVTGKGKQPAEKITTIQEIQVEAATSKPVEGVVFNRTN